MSVRGIVKQGIVVPDAALPEGACVEILLADDPLKEMLDELREWQLGSAQSLDTVEKLAGQE